MGGNYSKEETFFVIILTFIRMSRHTLVSCFHSNRLISVVSDSFLLPLENIGNIAKIRLRLDPFGYYSFLEA